MTCLQLSAIKMNTFAIYLTCSSNFLIMISLLCQKNVSSVILSWTFLDTRWMLMAFNLFHPELQQSEISCNLPLFAKSDFIRSDKLWYHHNLLQAAISPSPSATVMSCSEQQSFALDFLHREHLLQGTVSHCYCHFPLSPCCRHPSAHLLLLITADLVQWRVIASW